MIKVEIEWMKTGKRQMVKSHEAAYLVKCKVARLVSQIPAEPMKRGRGRPKLLRADLQAS